MQMRKSTKGFEQLEERRLKAADLAVPSIPLAHEQVSAATQSLDVDGDNWITHKDALGVISALVSQAAARSNPNSPTQTAGLEGESLQQSGLADVDGNGQISPADVLAIVDRIQFYNPLVPCTCASCVRSTMSNACVDNGLGAIQAATILQSAALQSAAAESSEMETLSWKPL